MGNEESTIRGPPSLQVQASLALFWDLSFKDQIHFMQILESRESTLRRLYQYHQVDISLEIWSMFANEEKVWSANLLMIDRWKQLLPYIKGIAQSKHGAIAFCTTPELATASNFQGRRK